MTPRNLVIQANYAAYEALLLKLKVALSSPLVLGENPQNRKFLSASVTLSIPSVEKAVLSVKRNKKAISHYGINIRALGFCPQPIIRFDADGPTHRNDVDSVPLALRQVTTPHFHKFDQSGVEIAYKTTLLSEVASVMNIQADMDAGMRVFSMEANVRCSDNSFPTVEEDRRMLPIPPTDYDPLAGIAF